jgi:hypothetical protein
MLYDVNVSRISTATKVMRVEADSPEQAEEQSLASAGDEEFAGCITDYDFDGNGVAPVADPSVPPFTMNVQPKDASAGKYEIQHELDDEPTYIVKAGTEEEVVTLSPSLPWQVRRKLAETIVAELEK